MARSEPALLGPAKKLSNVTNSKANSGLKTLPAGSRNDRNHAGGAALCAVQVNNRHADVHEVVDGGVEFQAREPGDKQRSFP